MALITCPECKGSVSDTAESCPHCGYKIIPQQVNEAINKAVKETKSATNKNIGILIFAVIISCLIAYYFFRPSKTETIKQPEKIISSSPSPPQNSFRVKPDMIVKFPQSGFACLTLDGLKEAVTHAVKGEETKFNRQIYSENNPNGECAPLYPDKEYR